MRCPRARSIRLAAVVAAVAAVTAACGNSSADTLTSTLSVPSGRPITVGISLPLSGDFQADGLASQRGYQLWASDVNGHGGLLGRPVRLIFLNDKSDENLTKANYVTLIGKDHVDLTLAPFSSLLTVDAATVCRKYGYAIAAGSAGAPSVYALGYRNVFSTNVPVAVQLEPFANWVLTLQGAQRPATAAYAMVNDPFADPPVITTQGKLEKAGIRTVYSNTAVPKNNPGYTNVHTAALMADAKQVAASNADMVVLGSVGVPTVAAFVKEFIKVNYQPKIFIATAGPDQGQSFLFAVGTGNADGIMVPNGWYGSFPSPLSHVMVQNYIAKYGGTSSDINADVAEAYSAGQVIGYAVARTHAFGAAGQKKIIDFLHSGVTVPTVLGGVRFSPVGQNLNATKQALIFQWQQGGHVFVPVLPRTETDLSPIIATKPKWTG